MYKTRCFFLVYFILTLGFGQEYPKTVFIEQDSLILLDTIPNPANYQFSKIRTPEPPLREKNFWRASSEWFLAQALPASFNRFIRKDPYSYISFKNFIDHQRLSAWDWDDNQFTTNQIDHPWHGHIYFNAFRSNGYNLWQSAVATTIGSYIWETGGETQHPSINDFINTTYGGILLGEMSHRVSRNILARNRKHPHQKVQNEIISFLVNPVNGLNRLLDGKWGKTDPYITADSSIIDAEFELGVRRFDAHEGDLLNKGKNSLYARLRFQYANGLHNYKRPFDQFSVNLEMGQGDSTFINAVNIHALMYGNRFFEHKNAYFYGLITAHYDFYNNDAFFYGAQSINYNFVTEARYRSNRLKVGLGLGAVILAAVPDPYLLYGDYRNYNYGSGASYRLRGELSTFNRLLIGLDYNGGIFHTISGNDSHYLLHAATLDIKFRTYKKWSMILSSGYFALEGNFADPELPDFNREFPVGRIGLAYNIAF